MINLKTLLENFREFKPHGIYRHACPNCGGPIDDYRLIFKAPCSKCLNEARFKAVIKNLNGEITRFQLLKLYYDKLNKKLKKSGDLKKLMDNERMLNDFEDFFEKAIGFKMWSAQRMWARRILKGSSFSIVAPTGMGKTVFSLIATLYLVSHSRSKNREQRFYLVFPTTPLLLQAERKIKDFSRNLGINVCMDDNWGSNCLRILCIHGQQGKKEKEAALTRLKEGDFDILLTTSKFMHKYYELLKNKNFKLIVMDDVDAVLKSGKAIRRVLNIIGIEDEYIDKALTLIKARSKLAVLSSEEKSKLEKEVESLEKEISTVKQNINTILLVNTATGRPRGIYPKLFKIFMNFEAGSKPEAIRNIVDTYIESIRDIEEKMVELALKLRDGLLIFVPVDRGVEYAEKIASLLKEKGLNAEAFHSGKPAKLLDAFARGEINILVGVATYYGVMVRGIDLPERVKYIMFIGVPRHKFTPELEELSPRDLLRILSVLRDASEGERKEAIDRLIGRLSSRIRRMSPGALMMIREELAKKLRGEPIEETPFLRDAMEAYKIIKEELSKDETWHKISSLGDIGVIREGNKYYMLIPDVATYIQASGRASRLYPGGITRGLSITLVDDKRLLNGLVKRMRWIFEDFNMVPLDQVNLEELTRQIEEERRRVAEVIREGIKTTTQVEPVKTALMIVESPNKAKTIANFFGKPSIRVVKDVLQAYEVTVGNYVLSIVASAGHVYDLITDNPGESMGENLYGVLKVENRFIPVYTDIKKCSNGHQFTDEVIDNTNECPKCRINGKVSHVTRKLDIVKALRELAEEVDVVLIGTDPDAEGEKIAWDLRVLLEPYASDIKRIEFHEVTRKAILNALKNPRDFDLKLVESQIVRRIDDRWLGFSLSEKVQKYAWLKYCSEYLKNKTVKEEKDDSELHEFDCCTQNRNLSAGRVQTPVLEYIVKETEERRKPERWSYRIKIYVEDVGDFVEVTIPYIDAEELGVIKSLNKKKLLPVEIIVIGEDVEEVNPLPPFTTDALLEEASRSLRLSAVRAMEIAQNLFETGLITYHRTDSTRVSDTGISIARQYLEEKYGEKAQFYFKARMWGEGGAHEAIRPTRPIDADRLLELIKEGVLTLSVKFTKDHIRLYDLIFRRFIASQMRPAKLRKLKFKVVIKNREYYSEVYTEAVEKGYLEVYKNIELVQGIRLKPSEPGGRINGKIHEGEVIKPPMLRFHDVVRWMKENGIGRPSTYAKIIQTIIDRRYVIVSGEAKALIPVERGRYVLKFLKDHYGDIVSVDTTRRLEDLMEKISRGERDYQEVLEEIYREVKNIVLENKDINDSLEKEYNERCASTT
ncbi:reverse gyrase [Desulfurococcus amylolyticus]|uniref:reverse gyrase n=1 Tax=Desulfurococcus amylolyticus TaxID=94694 RepID=UPI0023F4634F|nr:reverse gyrase [Desulfurococcus amylolyticus]